jgi:phosphatidylserine/phosphatidylglycerophosphate/cardiolipin synthase-like enzyme
VDLIVDRRHYDEVVRRALSETRVSLWIATANLKDVHVEAPIGSVARARGRFISITDHFQSLSRAGVEIRILHGALPSRPFRDALQKSRPASSQKKAELRHCPRVHLKMIVVDGAYLYLGSANFTGAGLGARGDGRRNFEMGLATDDDLLLDSAQQRFDRIWSGRECGSCKLRALCPRPLDGVSAAPASPLARATGLRRAACEPPAKRKRK